MEVPSETSKPYPGNDEPESKRQKSTSSSTITRKAAGGDNNARVLLAAHNELEPEVSAATQKQKNEISCPIFKLSNDELRHILGYVGNMQYGFVACTSYRFDQVYLETFGNETLTSFRNATV